MLHNYLNIIKHISINGVIHEYNSINIEPVILGVASNRIHSKNRRVLINIEFPGNITQNLSSKTEKTLILQLMYKNNPQGVFEAYISNILFSHSVTETTFFYEEINAFYT